MQTITLTDVERSLLFVALRNYRRQCDDWARFSPSWTDEAQAVAQLEQRLFPWPATAGQASPITLTEDPQCPAK